jgi:hypothetical protein
MSKQLLRSGACTCCGTLQSALPSALSSALPYALPSASRGATVRATLLAPRSAALRRRTLRFHRHSPLRSCLRCFGI